MPRPRLGNSDAPRGLLAAMLLASAALHLAVGFFLATSFRAPPLELEFQLPMDVEFGMTEEVTAAPALPPPSAAPQPSEAATSASDGDKPSPSKREKSAAKPAKEEAAHKPAPAAKPSTSSAEEAANARMPAGAQIAVRVDMSRIRRSPIAEDVRLLLAAIPDWNALLDGSGIDPVNELDRFMIATPNLQRSKIVVAGRYTGSEQSVLDAVARLATAQGQNATWSQQGNVRVAPWANADATPRVIALVGPAHFTISRAEDLPRVLAVAAARAEQRGRKGRPAEQPEAQHPADALLSMEEGEGLSVEVEGAEQFVRRASRGVPSKLRLSAREQPGLVVQLRGQLTFADAAKAEEGAHFWDERRQAYAANALVAMLGLAGPLRDGSIRHQGADVHLDVTLSLEQTRLILGYLRELVRPPPAPSSTAAPAVPSSSTGDRGAAQAPK